MHDADVDWAGRAAAAERAVVRRHVRPIAGVLPGTRIGRVCWPRRLPRPPFHWHYWWWNVASFPVIVVFGYLTFYVVAFVVYDTQRRSRQLAIVGGLATVDLVAGLLFGPALGWI